MGCLIYYVLSKGSHPFGAPLKRQINIEAGDYTLNDLLGTDRYTAEHIVHSMISFNYNFRLARTHVLWIVTLLIFSHAIVASIHVHVKKGNIYTG